VTKLRIGLTISGAVSLGAYEGGALAALLTAVQAMGPEAVVIDAITGASAGAITAVLTAQTLLRGLDPVDAMVKSWVELPSLARLATHSMESPLSAKVLSQEARRLLQHGGVRPGPGVAPQPNHVNVAITMTTLAGYHYRIGALMKATPVDATSYLDWAKFDLAPDTDDATYRKAAEAALASAANEMGFPPKLIKRDDHDREEAKRHGVLNPPNPAGTWYTDGGTVNNEPFGALLDLTASDPPQTDRVLLLVHPSVDSVDAHSVWDDPTSQPRWTRTGLRGQKIHTTQTIYEDLRKLEKTNTRVIDVEALAYEIDNAIKDPAARQAMAEAIGTFLDGFETRKAALSDWIGRPPPRAEDEKLASLPLRELLAAAIGKASGLEGKRTALVEVVTPAIGGNKEPVDRLLAGEKLGHFFGFTAERLRQSDFALGWRNMRTWLETGLTEYGVKAEVLAVLPTVDAVYHRLGWDGVREGTASFGSLHLDEKVRLGLLGAHIAHVVERDIRSWNTGFPVEPA
jgi:predicted acylesterase/phospholipase RssA